MKYICVNIETTAALGRISYWLIDRRLCISNWNLSVKEIFYRQRYIIKSYCKFPSHILKKQLAMQRRSWASKLRFAELNSFRRNKYEHERSAVESANTLELILQNNCNLMFESEFLIISAVSDERRTESVDLKNYIRMMAEWKLPHWRHKCGYFRVPTQ